MDFESGNWLLMEFRMVFFCGTDGSAVERHEPLQNRDPKLQPQVGQFQTRGLTSVFQGFTQDPKVGTYTRIRVHMYIHVYLYLYPYVHICIYTHTVVCTYTHVIYTYI